jgi:hypothetical protein
MGATLVLVGDKKSSLGTRDAILERHESQTTTLARGRGGIRHRSPHRLLDLGEKGDSTALRRMPSENRAKLYQETLVAATRTLCDEARNDALRDQCVSWAGFLLDFPECDDTCRAFAAPYAPHGAAR